MELTELKAQHDKLLAEKPEGLEHDATTCPICTEDTEGGDMSTSKTYTQEELDTAIAAVVAPLHARVEELASLEQVKVVEAKVAEAVAPLNDQISELQKTLDVETARAEAAEKNYSDLTSKMEADQAADTAAKEREAIKADRLAIVKEAASFKDEYIESNIERWTDLSEEAFTACVDDWKAVAAQEPVTKDDKDLLAVTAMKAVREDKKDGMSNMRALAMMALSGTDIKSA